jgi:hypothetical protein
MGLYLQIMADDDRDIAEILKNPYRYDYDYEFLTLCRVTGQAGHTIFILTN